jgi:hypothetical protein
MRKRTETRRALRALNKAFGANVTPRDVRHHHVLLPLWGLRNRNLVGYQCADPDCTELFTPSGNVSAEYVPRSGTSRFDLPRRSHNHKQRKELADARRLHV